MIPLRTTPERIAELRALVDAAPSAISMIVLPSTGELAILGPCERPHAAAHTAVPDLIADHADLTTENECFRAANEALRKALAPFGPINQALEEILWGHLPDTETGTLTTTLGNLRAVTRLLQPKDPSP